MKRKKSARWTLGLKKLKAISIRQPWAWLIVNGYKDIENRIWAANLRGPVLIHAGQSKSDTTPEALAYIKRRYRVANLPDTFETGGIVGIAEITDCVQRHRSKWFQGPFGWTLANARRLPLQTLQRPAQILQSGHLTPPQRHRRRILCGFHCHVRSLPRTGIRLKAELKIAKHREPSTCRQ